MLALCSLTQPHKGKEAIQSLRSFLKGISHPAFSGHATAFCSFKTTPMNDRGICLHQQPQSADNMLSLAMLDDHAPLVLLGC